MRRISLGLYKGCVNGKISFLSINNSLTTDEDLEEAKRLLDEKKGGKK